MSKKNSMKEIGYVKVDYSHKVNLAELAKEYEGRDVYLMFKDDAWDDTYLAVLEANPEEQAVKKIEKLFNSESPKPVENYFENEH